MTMNEPQLWEIWRFSFRYDDNPQRSKERPVVIGAKDVQTGTMLALAIKVTSYPPHEECQGDVALADWEEDGLDKLSTARCSKYLLVPIESFANSRRYGKLSQRDEKAVRAAMQLLGLIY